MVQVIVDSCASIPDKLIKQLDIKVVPYYIHRGVETLRDLVDVKSKEFSLMPVNRSSRVSLTLVSAKSNAADGQ
jgi:fatty acid-binding protein DegV